MLSLMSTASFWGVAGGDIDDEEERSPFLEVRGNTEWTHGGAGQYYVAR